MIFDYMWLSALSVWLLWTFYVAIMHLLKVHQAGNLKGLTRVFGYPVLLVGVILDTVVNWFVASIMFLEIPKEFLVTTRLQRHWKNDPKSWRGKLARSISNLLLDQFDPSGDHID